jgi:hypothetical protein
MLLIPRNTKVKVEIFITDIQQVIQRRRVQIPFHPQVDAGRIKQIIFYPCNNYSVGKMKYKRMYASTIQLNGVQYNVPSAVESTQYMLTLARKGGDYLFFDMPLANFIPNWGGNYRIPCDYEVDFDRSFIRLFATTTAIPAVIPLYFEMYPQDGNNNR